MHYLGFAAIAEEEITIGYVENALQGLAVIGHMFGESRHAALQILLSGRNRNMLEVMPS